jgi:hypothetical protein
MMPPGVGGCARSAASKASISFWKGWEVGLVVGRVEGGVWADATAQSRAIRQRAERGRVIRGPFWG